MKKVIFIVAVTMTVFSCTQQPTDKQNTPLSDPQIEQKSVQKETKDTAGAFKIENVPFTSSDLGEFPFFTLPAGLKVQNKSVQRDFDVCFFPVNSVMTPFEGKLYKVNVEAIQGQEFSKRYFEKSMEEYLRSIGAVQIYDGEISHEEYVRYHKQDPNKGAEGDMGYADEQIRFYVIRSQNQGNIYIQFSATNAAGKLNVLQEKVFQQTINKVIE